MWSAKYGFFQLSLEFASFPWLPPSWETFSSDLELGKEAGELE